jgi:hypothetical protein
MSNFHDRKKRRLEEYGASIERNGETILIKEFAESKDNALAQLEQIRRIFYPELLKGLRLDKTIEKLIR